MNGTARKRTSYHPIKKLPIALGTIALCFLPLSTESTAQAQELGSFYQHTKETSDPQSKVRAFLGEYGVDATTQELLIEKLNRGEIWDSLSGADPISVKKNGDKEIRLYADGSVSVFSVTDSENIPNALNHRWISPNSVSGCSRSGVHYATYWKSCNALWDYGFLQYRVNFDYQNVRGDGSKITNFRHARGDSQFGVISSVTVNRDAPNQISLIGYWQAPGGWSSRTHVNVLRSSGGSVQTLVY